MSFFSTSFVREENILYKTVTVFLTRGFLLAIAAVCLCMETTLLLKAEADSSPVLYLVFFSTLFVYNYRPSKLNNDKSTGIASVNFFLFLVVVGMMISSSFVNPEILLSLIPFGLLSIAYNLPFTGVRCIPYAKIFIITFTWSSVTVIMPAIGAEKEIMSADIGYIFASRMCFIFAVAMIFDIRDAGIDFSARIKTLPLALGIGNAKIIAYAVLFIHCMLVIFSGQIKNMELGVILLSAFLLACLVYYSSPARGKYFFLLMADGLMVFRFFALLVAVYVQ